MVQPSSSTTVQYPYIGEVMYEYFMDETKFIAPSVLPYFGVENETGYVPVIAREDILKLGDNDGSRASGSGYPRENYQWEDKNYTTVEYGWEYPLDDKRVTATAKTAKFDARTVAARLASQRLVLRREKRVADLLFNASTFSGYTGGVTNEWDDATNAVPRDDVQTAVDNIRTNTGMMANGLIIAYSTMDDILNTDQYADWAKYTGSLAENLPTGIQAKARRIAEFLGIDMVWVGNAVYDSAKKGQSFSSANVWDNEYALIGIFANDGTPIDQPNIGRQLLWTPDSATPIVTEGYREEQTRSEVIRVRQNQDEKVFFPECGYLLSNITT